MSIWKSALITGVALSTLLTLGMVNKAVSGHIHHGYNKPGFHQLNKYNADQKTKHFKHPVYGYAFKHPIHGYKFKHPVYGYIPISTVGKTSQPEKGSHVDRSGG